jgi:deoxyribodipyrimidine photo-lyase
MKPIIVWLHQDLRLSDNPALYHAVASGKPVIPLYILEEDTTNHQWQIGSAQRWWVASSCLL